MKARMTREEATANMTMILSGAGGAQVYVSNTNPAVIKGFTGKRAKPDFFYRFQTQEAAIQHAEKFIAEETARFERNNAPVSIKVGDILVSSWGWEQTNVDFYQVVELKGDFVKFREIESNKVYDGDMNGRAFPKLGEFCGEVVRRKIQKYCGDATVKISSYAYATVKPIDTVMAEGVRFTEYA